MLPPKFLLCDPNVMTEETNYVNGPVKATEWRKGIAAIGLHKHQAISLSSLQNLRSRKEKAGIHMGSCSKELPQGF